MLSVRGIYRVCLLGFIFSLFDAQYVDAAPGDVVQVQRPRVDGRSVRSRSMMIRRGRNQRVAPRERLSQVETLSLMNIDSAEFQKAISKAPLQVRLGVFKKIAESRRHHVTRFKRRIRGMQKENGRNKVAHSQKEFFEVTDKTFNLFHKIMGQNVIWFAVTESPGHLHTLIKDQDGKGRFHHNTYGEGQFTNQAGISSSLTQYALPVVLTDKEMDRFTRYFNAGLKEHNHNTLSHGVYGFYANKQLINKIACTNWATSASVGDLPRWVKTIDKRMIRAAKEKTLDLPKSVGKYGLYGALARAKTAKRRKIIVDAVLNSGQLRKWNKNAIKRLAKAFNRETSDLPQRPTDLVLRNSLAGIFGLSRSQDPAKWSYDLMLSKKVPIVGVLNKTKTLKDDYRFNFEIMGDIPKHGWVVKGNYRYLRNPGDGERGVIPDGRSSAHRPVAQPIPSNEPYGETMPLR